ncbi:hypothetical protein [Flavobacterium sp.]|uniref:hypothetical protein n=1 Tax=Flavobacterium sp. TaxID=239 RepID=UPI0026054E6B|nr:hypothetical protein [Flavobacterium sp.]
MKTKFLMLTLILSLAMVSCSKDSETESTSNITADEASVNAKIDFANDDVIDLVAEQEGATYANSTSGKIETDSRSPLTSCATITRVPAFGTAITPGTQVTKTIDFGTTGCTLNNGNVVKGIIVISFIYNPSATTHTVTYTFNNFYHNAIKFNGTKDFTITMTTETVSSPSHPIVTMNMDLTATFPDGRVFTRVGQRVREIIEGYGTVSWTDNVYQVTGSWTTSFPNTSLQTSTITTPLLVKMSCVAVNKPLIVQGVITYVRGNRTATLNFGSGECDNTAIFTINGNEYTIVIGNP